MVPTASPKAGYIGEDTANHLGDVLFCSGFSSVCLFFFAVLILPRWLIEVPGHVPILFGSFLELSKNRTNIDLSTSFLCRNSLNDTIKRFSS